MIRTGRCTIRGIIDHVVLYYAVAARNADTPSAHCRYTSDPAGPMSLFWTVTPVQLGLPCTTWRQDQPRGSNERTYSVSWLAFESPISMFAPPDIGGTPRRVPLTCMSCQTVRKKKLRKLLPAYCEALHHHNRLTFRPRQWSDMCHSPRGHRRPASIW